MPRLSSGVPRYRKHRASGQAVVTLSGQDFYLGPHGTKTSKAEYDRRIAEWLARGRRPLEPQGPASITCVELILAYAKFAKGYYRKNGKVTNEVTAILSAAKFLKSMYGKESASEFGPLKLQAIQQAMIQAGWCRKNINKQVGRIVRMFSWGVSQELVAAGVAHALREVKGLHKGRTDAAETAPVLPVSDSVVNATLERLPPIVADMVRLQRLTGCRPEEVCMIRPCDVDTSGHVWMYRPQTHKTAHHERQRVICMGPKAKTCCVRICFATRKLTVSARRTRNASGERKRTNAGRRPYRAGIDLERIASESRGDRRAPATQRTRTGGQLLALAIRRKLNRGRQTDFVIRRRPRFASDSAWKPHK